MSTWPTLIALETAVPPLAISQQEYFETICAPFYENVPEAEDLFRSTGVRQRHLAWDPRPALAHGSPLTGDRMDVAEQALLELGRRSTAATVAQVDRSQISSFVMASCTAYAGPVPNLVLAGDLSLSPNLRLTFIGHMGCNAAFNAIKVAVDSIAARPDDYSLVNCTEVCTCHVRPEASKEQAVIHALFGDASASFVLASREKGAGPRILGSHTEIVYETGNAMTWRICNDGFRMDLSPYVPLLLGEKISGFVDQLLAPAGLSRQDVAHWGIHPGGPKIVELIGDRLDLSDAQMRPSLHVLGEYGNCSSTTVLLVLDQILKTDQPRPGDYGVLLGFGPGLTLEGLLLAF